MDDLTEKRVILTHTVQGIESDAARCASPGWIARILERARWAVFGRDTFVLRDRVVGGVARAATFEYVRPLEIGDELTIVTWLARVGRTSYDFGHSVEIGGVVGVRARVTVVHLGPDGPAPIGEDLSAAVVTDPIPAPVRWAETDKRSAWSRRFIVRPSDQDSFGHVNQARYVDYIDDTRQLAAMSGARAGIPGPLASLSVEYLRETHAGDEVEMETWVTGEGSRAFELRSGKTGHVHSRGYAQAELID